MNNNPNRSLKISVQDLRGILEGANNDTTEVYFEIIEGRGDNLYTQSPGRLIRISREENFGDDTANVWGGGASKIIFTLVKEDD